MKDQMDRVAVFVARAIGADPARAICKVRIWFYGKQMRPVYREMLRRYDAAGKEEGRALSKAS